VSGFVKLDAGILDSSLWAESSDVCKVFITMLAMCEPDGLCRATAPGISRRAILPLEQVREALARLEAPDPDSRTPTDDGRRIRRAPGGYVVVNFAEYRKRDYTAAERKRRQRERDAVTDPLPAPLPLQTHTHTQTHKHRSHKPSQESRVTTVTNPSVDALAEQLTEASSFEKAVKARP
jgi:hypothetical protein